MDARAKGIKEGEDKDEDDKVTESIERVPTKDGHGRAVLTRLWCGCPAAEG